MDKECHSNDATCYLLVHGNLAEILFVALTLGTPLGLFWPNTALGEPSCIGRPVPTID